MRLLVAGFCGEPCAIAESLGATNLFATSKASEAEELYAKSLEDVAPNIALAHARKAGELGHGRACVTVGRLLSEGSLGYQDAAGAAAWFRKGAQLGNAEAQFELGRCYRDGWGVRQNAKESAKWLQRAGELNHAEAQVLLGRYLEHRPGIQDNYKLAAQWYRKAALQGSPEGCFYLAHAYLLGTGLPKDRVESYKWCVLAADQGFEPGAAMRDYLERVLSRGQIAEGKSRVRRLRETRLQRSK